ncbi:hypothetical protein FDP41_001159 [Naegleria fowleri]|uniref:AttH domain-containing protein n=1 Tax=Naegleria fowleri TaxID=5763 RepID=A0A6A5BXC8_NAEFO|nr:uncharacterized protein FDP41_001159 [Naegleria fowleri]KAF0980006.1 hypothetical protein FDP41_001159 [Naegleria fowleri]CAG4710157.1 unnamed protein product [Naegleria fowleri]
MILSVSLKGLQLLTLAALILVAFGATSPSHQAISLQIRDNTSPPLKKQQLPLVKSVRDILSCSDNETLTLSSDAYQFPNHHSNNILEAYYHEWWFFAFFDPIQDIGFCVGYGVQNQLHAWDHNALATIAGMVWPSVLKKQPNNNTNVLDMAEEMSIAQFSGSTQNASVSIALTNTIQVIDERTYIVSGGADTHTPSSTRNMIGKAKWWLTLEQTVPACREMIEVPELLQLDWISYMPASTVKGIIQLDGKNYSIHTVGYHDHNYGSWPTSYFNWIWAQFNHAESDFALVLGAYTIPLTNSHAGYIFLRYRGRKVTIGTLCGDVFELTPLEFVTSPQGKRVSVHNKVVSYNKEWKVVIDYKAQVSDRNPG